MREPTPPTDQPGLYCACTYSTAQYDAAPSARLCANRTRRDPGTIHRSDHPGPWDKQAVGTVIAMVKGRGRRSWLCFWSWLTATVRVLSRIIIRRIRLDREPHTWYSISTPESTQVPAHSRISATAAPEAKGDDAGNAPASHSHGMTPASLGDVRFISGAITRPTQVPYRRSPAALTALSAVLPLMMQPPDPPRSPPAIHDRRTVPLVPTTVPLPNVTLRYLHGTDSSSSALHRWPSEARHSRPGHHLPTVPLAKRAAT